MGASTGDGDADAQHKPSTPKKRGASASWDHPVSAADYEQLEPTAPDAASTPDAKSGRRGSMGGSGGGRGGRHCGVPQYESLNYEQSETIAYRSNPGVRGRGEQVVASVIKWTLCALIGVCMAITAFAINIGVENIAAVKMRFVHTAMGEGMTQAWLFYCLFDVILVGASVGICALLSPAARGSGIPDVKAYLNGVDVPGVLSTRTLIAKVTAITGTVASGLAVGKEGPFVHIGACIAAQLSRVMSYVAARLYGLQLLNTDWEVQDYVTCGGAAGVAAAFRAPVGGVLFGLEELSSWFRSSVLWHMFFSTAVVTVCVRVGLKWCAAGNCGWFGLKGNQGFLVFNMTDGQDDYEAYELLPVLLLGVVGGLLGSAFNSLHYLLACWREEVLHLPARAARGSRAFEALAISLLTSTVTFVLPLMFRCTPCPPVSTEWVCPSGPPHLGNYVSLNCGDPRSYNDMATLVFTTQDDAIRNLFSANTSQEYSVEALLTYFVVYYMLAIITHGIAVPSGLFVPCILCGATYGRLVGMLMTTAYPNSHMDEGTYALLGAASFLGGAMRSTVSLCVMLLELTGHLNLLPLIMLVLLVSKAVGDSTGVKSIYELLLELKRAPYLAPQADKFMRSMTAASAASSPVVTLQAVERVGAILDVLSSTSHNGFPVVASRVEKDSPLQGLILREHLMALLASRRCFQRFASDSHSQPLRPAAKLDPAELAAGRRLASIPGLGLQPQHLEQYLDLRPFLGSVSYMVPESASLAKVYGLFRALGLRHLLVVPGGQPVCGIITRKDLLPEVLEPFVPDGRGRARDGSGGGGSSGPASPLAGSVAGGGSDGDGEQVPLIHSHASGRSRPTQTTLRRQRPTDV